jgi:hypothetical protein
MGWGTVLPGLMVSMPDNGAWQAPLTRSDGISGSAREIKVLTLRVRARATCVNYRLKLTVLKVTDNPNGGDPDGPKAIKMLDDNLAAVPRRVLSPAGRRRAPALDSELRKFLQDLRRETDNLRTL